MEGEGYCPRIPSIARALQEGRSSDRQQQADQDFRAAGEAGMVARMPTRIAIAIIVVAELLGTSLWFSANAVVDALQRDWGISVADLGHLTSAVQLGFISGTLVIALTGLADRFSAARIFAVTALLGALANSALAWAADGLASALVYRFVTGIALAGVYPVGMKLVVSWAPARAGNVLGWLVGMLAIGSGVPHFVRGLELSANWHSVIYAASSLAVIAAIMVGWLGDGPHHGIARRLQWGGVLQSFRVPRFRAASFGYFGHMWELYAFFALVPLLVAPYLDNATPRTIYLAAAGAFLAGGVGCIVGGMISHRVGSARVAMVALAGSAICCFVWPLAQGLPAPLLLALLWAWGLLAVTDSPQFSALAAGALPPERMGSALAFMNSVGFAITIVAIELATGQWKNLGPQIGWLLLPGPLLGLFFMTPLWRDGGKAP